MRPRRRAVGLGRDSLRGVDDEARAARRSWVAESGVGLATSPFRVDRDRIAASPFFARLAGVTQVVSPAGAGLLVHNRLTHSLQVAQVARAIAERVACDPLVAKLGGCDPDVVEAAALAHDLGHPPFGHLGEQVLDRVARERLGLPDGFEGNAQSFRIVTTIDLHGPSGTGLDLTAAVRAAVLKYPWTRRDYPDPHPSGALLPPRGGGPLPGAPDAGSAKFSAYSTELDDLVDCRDGVPGRPLATDGGGRGDGHRRRHRLRHPRPRGLPPGRRAAAGRGGDGADRLGQAARASTAPAQTSNGCGGACATRTVGPTTTTRSRRPSPVSATTWSTACSPCRSTARWRGSGRSRSSPRGGRRASSRASTVGADPPVRSAHVALATAQWHEVAVLKFVHQRFVLRRADLASHQRGQATVLAALVDALTAWLAEDGDGPRLPPRLHDLVELSRAELGATAPARGRAVVDYVASLTDGQATALLDVLTGRSSRLWTDAPVL